MWCGVAWCGVYAYSSNYSGNEGVGLFELKVLRPALQDPISKEEIKGWKRERGREREMLHHSVP